MLWAVFTLAFYGFFRASELVQNLHWSDIVIYSNKLSVTLHQSKTDPFRHGVTIQIFPTGSSTCPVRAMTCYFKLLNGTNAGTPVFSAGRFHPLTQRKLNIVIRHLLKQGGINQLNYASHNFRIGAATTAAAAGLPAWLIKTLGRWNSDAYLTYIRCPNTVLSAVPHKLANTDATNQPSWDPNSC